MSEQHTAEKDAGRFALLRWLRRRRKPQGGGIDLAVDRDGNRYTTHCFAANDDPWYGATILTSGVVRDLRERRMLPLTECVIPPGGSDV